MKGHFKKCLRNKMENLLNQMFRLRKRVKVIHSSQKNSDKSFNHRDRINIGIKSPKGRLCLKVKLKEWKY